MSARDGSDTGRNGAAYGRGGIRGGTKRERLSEVSFIRLVNVLLGHWRIVVGAPFVVAVLMVAATVLSPEEYTSSGTFLPQDEEQRLSGMSGLASQFGMSVPTSLGGGRSPAFYADLVRSENLLQQVVTHEYSAAADDAQGDSTAGGADLVQFFNVEGQGRPQRVAAAVERLREKMSTGADTETGVVSLSVTTKRPGLSKQVADRIIDLVNKFNLQRRRSQVEAERKFLEDRVQKARADLEAAEDSLETFLERNRRFQNSPTLRFRHQDLQRRVDMEQQIYTSLMQSLQQARIEEVRSTPVITVVEPPRTPARPSGRSLLLVVIFGLMVGALGAVVWALGDQYFKAVRETDPEEYDRFRELRRQIASDLRGLWRRFRSRG